MGVAYDVIFSVTAGVAKVYPDFLYMSNGIVQRYEEKFRGHLMHTGTPSANGLTRE